MMAFNPLSNHPALAKRARPCWRKEKHKSMGAASAAARSLKNRGILNEDKGKLEPYQCPFCGWYHTGRSKDR